MAAYVIVNTTNNGPNYTTSRDVTTGDSQASDCWVLMAEQSEALVL